MLKSSSLHKRSSLSSSQMLLSGWQRGNEEIRGQAIALPIDHVCESAGTLPDRCGKIENDEVLAQGVSLHGDVSRAVCLRGDSCLRSFAKL